MPMTCGLLGEKLGHSRSPEIHRRLGDYSYRLYERRPDEVEEFLRHGDYDVLNVTIPYKKTAFALCDTVSPIAAKLGNVNVVVKRMDGRLHGDNTDAGGFRKLVETVAFDPAGRACVILGTGGAANTAGSVLAEMGAASIAFISRSGPDHYGNLARHADAALLVNATPVGMFPHVDAAPVSLDSFPACEAVIDLIYNPSPTKLLAEASRRGLRAVGGLVMLEEQARLASAYMNANLYLYGPPGSGKSTLGRELAAHKAMPFVDLDAEIERVEGRTIPEIFAASGEAAFRAIERRELRRIAAGHGQVVALGGGALLAEDSRALAERTGRVILLECPEEELIRRVTRAENRPLLAGDAASHLRALLAARQAHYDSFGERLAGYCGDGCE